jgi:hypothetical protein
MLTFILITAGFIIIFGALLLLGIVKKSRKAVYFSLLFLLFAICSGIYTGFLFARKAYHVIRTAENPLKRSGMEIYTALLGKPETNCVTVINSKDQYVPRLDCCIWLEFTTCPTELARIITKQPYQPDSMGLPSYGPAPGWFTPQKLGTGAVALRYSPDSNHEYSLYFSKDSSHAYYCDMLD